mmetsp:Transcript_36099/g.88344  ORF Transcript_36099/g.88344 Transcript_36099/m.88344 type:complete len:256 (-) Transcript_36099:6-773(-)
MFLTSEEISSSVYPLCFTCCQNATQSSLVITVRSPSETSTTSVNMALALTFPKLDPQKLTASSKSICPEKSTSILSNVSLSNFTVDASNGSRFFGVIATSSSFSASSGRASTAMTCTSTSALNDMRFFGAVFGAGDGMSPFKPTWCSPTSVVMVHELFLFISLLVSLRPQAAPAEWWDCSGGSGWGAAAVGASPFAVAADGFSGLPPASGSLPSASLGSGVGAGDSEVPLPSGLYFPFVRPHPIPLLGPSGPIPT